MENEILAHEHVVEAAVVAIDDERWQERPLAIVVAETRTVSAQILREHLEPRVARFWLPEYWVFVDEIPKTSVGKIDKKALRAALAADAFDVNYVK